MRNLEQKYAKQIVNVLKKQIDKIKINNADFYSEELLSIYNKMYKETLPKFANAQYRTMRKEKQFGGGVEWTAFVNEWLATNGFSLVSTVFNNYRDVIINEINKATTEAIQQGLGITETANLINERLNAFRDGLAPGFIAERIARTEIVRAANLGHMKGAEALPYQVKKMWISAKDHRTRRMPKDLFDHWVLDGVQKELNEPFTQTGKNSVTLECQQPGDLMNGQDKKSTAAFTINCRCTIGFVAKRDANGKLIPKVRQNNPINGEIQIPKPIIPKPSQISIQQTEGFVIGKNNRETAKNLQKYIKEKTGLNINSVSINRSLSIEDFNEKAIHLSKLFDEYKIHEGLNTENEVNIIFNSGKRFLGIVKSRLGMTNFGKVSSKSSITEMNFGHLNENTNSVTFIKGNESTRFNSAIDTNKIKLGVPTHEFAHVLAISQHTENPNTPEYIKEYFKELREIRGRYVNEMLELNKNRNKQGVYNISLGQYASTNIDEFHAEAFKEYKLNSNPSKYAIEVGRLIDKYFKNK